MFRLPVLLMAIALAQPSIGIAQLPAAPIYQDTADTLRLRLIDAESGQPLQNAEVEVYSDNGTRCVRAPCPTDGRTWRGHSDHRGIVAFPASELAAVNHIRTATHEFFDLARARRDPTTGTWVVRLLTGTTGVPVAMATEGQQRKVSNTTSRKQYGGPVRTSADTR